VKKLFWMKRVVLRMVQASQVLTLLMVSLGSRVATGFYTYNDNYSEENYEYNEEVEVEEEANYLPVFESSPTVYRVRGGNTARLECKVDNLGPMVLSWRRLINNTSEYIATGSIVMVRDKRFSILTSTSSSMLLITLMTPKDTGEYVCEVSSTPPVHIKHWLKMKAPPSASILGKPSSGQFTIKSGEELGLVCRGGGEPAPALAWKREGQPLPDGEMSVAADQIIYSSVGRGHAGTYTCVADNGAGRVARDSVVVQVTYAPVISVDHSYIHNPANISLELVCYVESFPVASVQWSRTGEHKQINMDKARVGLRGLGRHVLILDNPQKSDLGPYQCSANNTMGTVVATISISEESETGTEGATTQEEDTVTIVETESASDTPAVLSDEKGDHKLLKHIIHKMKKFEHVNNDMVKAMKQSNRYLFQILRNQKILLNRNSTNNIL